MLRPCWHKWVTARLRMNVQIGHQSLHLFRRYHFVRAVVRHHHHRRPEHKLDTVIDRFAQGAFRIGRLQQRPLALFAR